MQKKICHDSRTSYMAITPTGDVKDALSMHMMKNNMIEGFLNMECRYVDNEMTIYYEIQGMQCLKDLVGENGAGFDIARQVYVDLSQALSSGEEFFLNESSFVLDLEYMYYDRRNKRINICCMPEWHEDFQDGVKKLTEEIITHVDHSDKQAESFMYGMYDLIQAEGFSVDGARAYIKGFKAPGVCADELGDGRDAFTRVQKEDESKNASMEQTDLKRDFDSGQDRLNDGAANGDDAKKEYPAAVKYGLLFTKGKNKEKTIWLNEGGESKNGHVTISVGRSGACGIMLPCSQVSRQHAEIVIDGASFYLSDVGSTNGTFVNGRDISGNGACSCKCGDVIAFADIAFYIVAK